WGTAEANAEISLSFGGLTARATADSDGAWRVMLGPLAASAESRELVVEQGVERLILKDVLVGRVWLCSGQSNMDFTLGRAMGGRDEAKTAAQSPAIRLFNLTGAPTDARTYDAATLARLNPQDHFSGTWETASEKSASGFSAVAWWTGKMIHE